jgi:hypothetical protein
MPPSPTRMQSSRSFSIVLHRQDVFLSTSKIAGVRRDRPKLSEAL